MDPAQNPLNDAFLHNAELQSIFRQELEERTAHLVEGATQLTAGEADLKLFEDRARDAHTIKGNAGVMGFAEIATLAKAVEEVWRDLAAGSTHPSSELGRDLIEAAELVPQLVEPSAISAAKAQALTTKLSAYADETTGDPKRPDSLENDEDVTDTGVDDTVLDLEDLAPEPISGEAEPEAWDSEPGAEPEDLGGLISSLERRIIGTSTRVETGKLYRLLNSIAEARLDTEALAESVQNSTVDGHDAGSYQALDALSTTMSELQQTALELAATQLQEVTDTFPQLVRYLSRRTGKEVRFELDGADVEIDRQIADHLREPLRHLIVNAVDHGVELPDTRVQDDKPPTGCVAIRTSMIDNRLQVTVEDDGAGIDWDRVALIAAERGLITDEPTEAELARVLFLPEFSTLSEANDLSGDGVGLAAVAELAEMLNGGMTIESRAGEGTSVVLTLPSSWALQDVVLFEAERKQWGIPAATVLASFPISAADIRPGEARMELIYQGHQHVPISSFAAAVGLPEVEAVEEVAVLATRVGPVAVTVPRIVGRRQLAVKGLGPLLSGVPHLTGAALLGGGEVVVIVEPNRLGERVRTVPSPITSRARVLVVDDSMGVRQLISAALTSHGFETIVASDATEALDRITSEPFDGLVVDYSMPGQSGVDLIRAVRRESIAIPIVMVSAVASSDDQAQAWAAGVDAYLDKFDLRKGVLASTLRSLVQLRGSARAEEDQ